MAKQHLGIGQLFFLRLVGLSILPVDVVVKFGRLFHRHCRSRDRRSAHSTALLDFEPDFKFGFAGLFQILQLF